MDAQKSQKKSKKLDFYTKYMHDPPPRLSNCVISRSSVNGWGVLHVFSIKIRLFWLLLWFLSAHMVLRVQKMAGLKLSSRSLRKKIFKNFLWVFTTENWTCPQNQIAGFGLFGQFALNPVLRRIFSQKIDFLDFSRRYRPISWGIFRKYFFTFPKIFLGVWTMFWGLYG